MEAKLLESSSDEIAIFQAYIDPINSERETLWARHNALLLANSLIIGALAISPAALWGGPRHVERRPPHKRSMVWDRGVVYAVLFGFTSIIVWERYSEVEAVAVSSMRWLPCASATSASRRPSATTSSSRTSGRLPSRLVTIAGPRPVASARSIDAAHRSALPRPDRSRHGHR